MDISQQAERSLDSEFRDSIREPFLEAVRRYRLVRPGDRVAVCISGGKDSMLLAKLMQLSVQRGEIPAECVYLIMDPGYSPANRERVEANAKLLGIPYQVFNSDIFQVANSQERNPCFLCARMRRGFLYGRARELGCSKIALGHHFDDVIETTVMALLYGAQLQAMPPRLSSKNFPGMELIRPLYLIREQDIMAWRDRHNLSFIQCACRFTEGREHGSVDSKRQEIKLLLRRLSETHPDVARRVFEGICHLRADTLAGWKSRGEEHSFLEWYEPEAR